MVTQLFEIVCTNFYTSPFDGCISHTTKVVAVCSTKNKAISMLKRIAGDPSCEGVIEARYDEELEMTYIKNRWGYNTEYRIEDIILDEWID